MDKQYLSINGRRFSSILQKATSDTLKKLLKQADELALKAINTMLDMNYSKGDERLHLLLKHNGEIRKYQGDKYTHLYLYDDFVFKYSIETKSEGDSFVTYLEYYSPFIHE